MNQVEQFYLQLIDNPAVQGLLAPAALIYGAGSYLRLRAYADGLMPRFKPSVPVISIGNLSVGGTGKTPVTIDIAERILAQGLKPAILSRGYKRISTSPYTVVSDGRERLADALSSGDEPYMMAQALSGAVVISGKSRRDTAALAVEKYGCQVVVLDDGFQHLQLRRDYDVVLLDYNIDPDRARLLPAGLLREPLSALGRATHIIITKMPDLNRRAPDDFESSRLASFQEKIARYAPSAQVSMCAFRPTHARGSSLRVNLDRLVGKEIIAACGIAQPANFLKTLSDAGCRLRQSRFFPDHHWFSPADIQELQALRRQCGAQYIVVTEKDLARIPPQVLAEQNDTILALCIAVEWIGDAPRFSLPAARPLEVSLHA